MSSQECYTREGWEMTFAIQNVIHQGNFYLMFVSSWHFSKILFEAEKKLMRWEEKSFGLLC